MEKWWSLWGRVCQWFLAGARTFCEYCLRMEVSGRMDQRQNDWKGTLSMGRRHYLWWSMEWVLQRRLRDFEICRWVCIHRRIQRRSSTWIWQEDSIWRIILRRLAISRDVPRARKVQVGWRNRIWRIMEGQWDERHWNQKTKEWNGGNPWSIRW